jgi:predicted MFS family arabinose efflux permease
MLLAATQDVATDGLAVHAFGPAERGPANGLQVGGYYLGQMLGGGGLLLLHAAWGWRPALLVMAAVLATPLVPLALYREPAGAAPGRPGAARVGLGALRRFFARPGAGAWVAVLLLYRAGEMMATTMLSPMLVDRGRSLPQIAGLMGVGSSVASLLGALAGGLLVSPLGRKRALVLLAGVQALAISGYVLPASGRLGGGVVELVVVVGAFCGGMATATLYTAMMDHSARATAATDFTVQQSLAAVGPLVAAALSGWSAARLGFSGHFALCATIAAATAVLVALRVEAWEPERAPGAVAETAPIAR